MDKADDMAITALQAIMGGVPTRAAVACAELDLLQHEQVECPVYHRFGPGIYIREVNIPAGVVSIGHHQRTKHLNIMLKGRVTMLGEDGSLREVTAPTIFVSNPGRKIGYIHEDMVWLNVYPTTETDIEKLEEMFLEKSDSWMQNNDMKNGIEKLNHIGDRSDYEKFLSETGIPESVVRGQSENKEDQIPFPYGGWPVLVGPSPIEGKGLFATAPIEAGELIAPARINGMRTPAGRYTNHAKDPNAMMVKTHNGDIELVALRDISGCVGGYNGEEITIDYRQALSVNIGGASCQE